MILMLMGCKGLFHVRCDEYYQIASYKILHAKARCFTQNKTLYRRYTAAALSLLVSLRVFFFLFPAFIHFCCLSMILMHSCAKQCMKRSSNNCMREDDRN